jgi:hypothetical protein
MNSARRVQAAIPENFTVQPFADGVFETRFQAASGVDIYPPSNERTTIGSPPTFFVFERHYAKYLLAALRPNNHVIFFKPRC